MYLFIDNIFYISYLSVMYPN